jgi:hypothetical protein
VSTTIFENPDRLDSFESLDRLVTLEMRPRGLPVGIVPRLYEVARGTDEPRSLASARALLSCQGSSIAIVTGVVAEGFLPKGETDGPIGAGVLGSVLTRCGVNVDVIVPDEMTDVMRSVRDVLGSTFEIKNSIDSFEAYSGGIAVEKIGRNRKRVVHSIFGTPLPSSDESDDFFEFLSSAGLPSVGLGDGGNEIGFGAIFEDARRIVPLGAECVCPCGDGLVTSTPTSIVFPVAVSNFGAYAIAAAIAILTKRDELLASPDLVEQAMRTAIQEGSLDAAILNPDIVGDDGYPLDAVVAIVSLVRVIARQHFRELPEEAKLADVYPTERAHA